MSKLLTATIRNTDTAARLGGDEFGVILHDCSSEQAQRMAQAICDRMDEYRFTHDGKRFRIGTSIGLVPLDSRWPDKQALMQAADVSWTQPGAPLVRYRRADERAPGRYAMGRSA